jgi:hypothetical protein
MRNSVDTMLKTTPLLGKRLLKLTKGGFRALQRSIQDLSYEKRRLIPARELFSLYATIKNEIHGIDRAE